jgi:hypothetical protein
MADFRLKGQTPRVPALSVKFRAFQRVLSHFESDREQRGRMNHPSREEVQTRGRVVVAVVFVETAETVFPVLKISLGVQVDPFQNLLVNQQTI